MRATWYLSRALVRGVYTYLFQGRAFGVHHVPTSGGVLLVSNHQSYFDPVLLSLALPRETHHMARDTLFSGRFGAFIRYWNAFPVKRGAADLGAIRESVKRLRDGGLLIVYPEGTRTRDGEVGPMHAGMMLVARRAAVPIVPAAVCGAYEVWPRTERWPAIRPVLVSYGEPITPAVYGALDDPQSMSMIRERIVAMRARLMRHPLLAQARRSGS